VELKKRGKKKCSYRGEEGKPGVSVAWGGCGMTPENSSLRGAFQGRGGGGSWREGVKIGERKNFSCVLKKKTAEKGGVKHSHY